MGQNRGNSRYQEMKQRQGLKGQNRYYIYLSIIVCTLVLSIVVSLASHASPSAQVRFIQLRPAQPGNYRSPDRHYSVRYMIGDASEADTFVVFQSKIGRRKLTDAKNLLSIRDLYKIMGFAWVPHHPHMLVFAVKCGRRKPFIAIWNGSKHITLLVKGTLPPNQDPDTENLQLVGVATNGLKIIYKHEEGWRTSKKNLSNIPERTRYTYTLPALKTLH